MNKRSSERLRRSVFIWLFFYRFGRFLLFFFQRSEEDKGKRQRKEEREKVGHCLTKLYSKKLVNLWQQQNRRDIKQALSGYGQQGSERFISHYLIGQTSHEVQGKQRHAKALEAKRERADFGSLLG